MYSFDFENLKMGRPNTHYWKKLSPPLACVRSVRGPLMNMSVRQAEYNIIFDRCNYYILTMTMDDKSNTVNWSTNGRKIFIVRRLFTTSCGIHLESLLGSTSFKCNSKIYLCFSTALVMERFQRKGQHIFGWIESSTILVDPVGLLVWWKHRMLLSFK